MWTVLSVLLAAAPAAPVAGDTTAEALVRRAEARHAKAGDLVARFTQIYRSGALRREVTERGVVSIKPPGRMLWEYKDPEKKTFVADGKTFWFYVPADRQVIVSEQDDARSIPALLLSGRGDLLAQFGATLETPPAEGLYRVRLTPKKPDPEVEDVKVDLEANGRLKAIEVRDTQGNVSIFRFDDVRENVGLKDGLFRFQPPAGVEVIRG
jgi:outer membrane lipoprotein carrier protein